jgi:hypothetical protein
MNTDAVKFQLGQMVYYKPKPERVGIVSCIHFSESGVRYTVSWDDFQDRSHYAIELTAEKNFAVNE